ncbi:hypothetical protein T09_15002, partial [Trichinella sp. T9]
MYIIEAFIVVILNLTPNNRHSVYYATLFAPYSLKLHAAFINVVDYILQRCIQKSPGLLLLFSDIANIFHEHQLSGAEFFLLPHPLQATFEARIGF